MRMIFGVIGLLVTVGVIVLILAFGYLPHAKTTIDAGNKAQSQAGQIAGVDTATGMRASESLKMEGAQAGGRLESVLVTDIIVGGPMEKYFGLRRNDSIVEVGPQQVRDINDEDLAKDLIVEAYQRQWPLVVVRDGQRMKLEPGSGARRPAAPAVAGSNPADAAAAAPEPERPTGDPGNALQRQLNTINRIPTH